MRIPTSHSRSRRDNEVMTPMIDVVFLLLIFFVCAAAGQVRESVLPTDMSAAGSVESSEPVEQDPWITEVWLTLRNDAAGQMLIDMNGTEQFRDPAALEGRLTALAQIAPDNPVILDIGPQVRMGDVIAVYDLCLRAGFESPNFAAKAVDVLR